VYYYLPYLYIIIITQKQETMKATATHPKFSEWRTSRIELDRPVNMTEKAVQLIGEIVKGSVWFPLSCVNVLDTFTVEVPVWLLKKKDLDFLV
jgi:hypothetical protein